MGSFPGQQGHQVKLSGDQKKKVKVKQFRNIILVSSVSSKNEQKQVLDLRYHGSKVKVVS